MTDVKKYKTSSTPIGGYIFRWVGGGGLIAQRISVQDLEGLIIHVFGVCVCVCVCVWGGRGVNIQNFTVHSNVLQQDNLGLQSCSFTF